MENKNITVSVIKITDHHYSGGYYTILVRPGSMTSIESQIVGCVDNRVRYSSIDIAERMMQKYLRLKDKGFVHTVSLSSYSGAYTIKIGRYQSTIGDLGWRNVTSIELDGRELFEIERSLKMAKKHEATRESIFRTDSEDPPIEQVVQSYLDNLVQNHGAIVVVYRRDDDEFVEYRPGAGGEDYLASIGLQEPAPKQRKPRGRPRAA